MTLDELEKLEDEQTAFENKFIEAVTGNVDYELIAVPDMDGNFPSEDYVYEVKKNALRNNLPLAYHVEDEDGNILFFTESGKTLGIIYNMDTKYNEH